MPLYIPLLAVIITNFFLTFYLLNRYSNFGRQNLLITISVFISWFFSFNVVFILPLDITSVCNFICNQSFFYFLIIKSCNFNRPFTTNVSSVTILQIMEPIILAITKLLLSFRTSHHHYHYRLIITILPKLAII